MRIGCVKICKSVTSRRSFRPDPIVCGRQPMTSRCTNGATLIENFFQKLKEFKRIALRADKTDASFAAMIQIVAAVLNSR